MVAVSVWDLIFPVNRLCRVDAQDG